MHAVALCTNTLKHSNLANTFGGFIYVYNITKIEGKNKKNINAGACWVTHSLLALTIHLKPLIGQEDERGETHNVVRW